MSPLTTFLRCFHFSLKISIIDLKNYLRIVVLQVLCLFVGSRSPKGLGERTLELSMVTTLWASVALTHPLLPTAMIPWQAYRLGLIQKSKVLPRYFFPLSVCSKVTFQS